MNVDGGALYYESILNNAKYMAALRQMEDGVLGTSRQTEQEAAKMDAAFNRLSATLAGVFSIAAAQAFVSEIVNVRGEFQKLEIAFTTMLGSKEKSDQLMKELIDYASTTPYGLKESAQAAKQLLAYGSSASTVTDEMRMLGDVSAGVSAQIGDIVYLYGTLRTQGRAYAVDIRQFAGRGIPIYEELGRVLNISTKEVASFVEAGKVGFKEVEQAFKNMTAAGGMFGGLMEAQSASIPGQIEKLKDAWDVMLNDIGKSNEGIINTGISSAAALVENYEKVINIIGILIGTYGAYKAAVIATAAFEKVSAASKFGMVTVLNQESVARAVNAAALANEMRAQVSSLATKKALTLQSASLALAELNTAKQRLITAQAEQVKSLSSISASVRETAAKNVQIATNSVLAAQEKAGITRKAALTASSEFHTAKTNLETTAKAANAGVTVELTAAEGLNAAGKRVLTSVTAAYNAVLAASPMIAFTAAAVALGLIIYSLTQITDAAEEVQRKLNDAQEEGGKVADKEKNKIQDLISVIKSHTSSVEQKKAAYDKLQDSTNGILISYSQEDIAQGKATKSIEEYIAVLREATAARKAFSDFQELADQMDKINRKGSEAIGTFKRAGLSMKAFFAPEWWTKEGRKDWVDGLFSDDPLIKKEKESIQTQMDELKKTYNDKWDEIITGTPKTQSTVADKARTTSVIDEEIKKLKDKQQEVSKTREQWNSYQVQINKLEAEKTAITGKLTKTDKKYSDDRKKVLDDIIKAENEAFRKGLTNDEAEIQAAKDKYEALRNEAKKAGLGSGTTTRIDNIERKVTGDLRYDQDTEKLTTELEKQKNIFSQYEEYKINTSKEAADKRFEGEKAEFDSYGDYLREQLALTLSQGFAGGFTGPVQNRIADLSKLLEEYNQSEKTKQDQRFVEALKASETFEQKKAGIEKRFQKQRDELLKLPSDSYAQQSAVLDKLEKEEIESAQDTAIKKTAIYRKMAEEIVQYTRQSLKKEIEAAENLLKTANLSPELRSDIEKELEDLKVKLKVGVDIANLDELNNSKDTILQAINDPLAQSAETAKKLKKQLKEVQNQIDAIEDGGKGEGIFNFKGGSEAQKVMGQIAENGKYVADSFNDWSDALAGSNDELSYTLGQIGEIVNIGTNLAKALASGNPVAQIAGIISAAASLFSMGKKVKQMNAEARAEQKKFYDEALKGERDYQALLRQRERDTVARGKSSYKAIIAELDLLKSQAKPIEDAYNKIYNSLRGQQYIEDVGYEHGTWFRKAKTWDIMASLGGADYAKMEQLYTQGKLKDQAKVDFEALKNLREEMLAAGIDVDNLKQQLDEMLTGTTSSGLADSLSELFQNGKLAAADFGQSFEEIMKNSINNTFKYKVMEDAMRPFYDSLSDIMIKGTPTKDQIDGLKDQYLSISEILAEQYKNLESVTGMNLKDTSTPDSGLKGAIKRELTEQTASEMTGLYRATYDLALRQYNLLMIDSTSIKNQNDLLTRQLFFLSGIEQHTLRTANNTDLLSTKLDQIITNTKPGQTTRDMGI